MIVIGMAAARRSMRRHQGIPPRRPRQPLWRLLLGEAGWALRQLIGEPLVLGGLVVGGAVTLVVLGAAAPGPSVPLAARVVVALLVGLAIAHGTWAWVRRRGSTVEGREQAGVAATEVVAAVAGLVLLGWLGVWLVATVA